MEKKEEKPAAPISAQPKDNKPKGRPQQAAPQQIIRGADGKEIRGIIRLCGKDVKGQMLFPAAVRRVKGIGLNIGQVIAGVAMKELGAKETTMVGELSEKQIERLEYVLSHPSEFGVPVFMLNHRKDMDTGEDVHVIGTDLTYKVQQDVGLQKDIYTWRGYRHAYGQKVRGQRTRSTGRTGMTVGVIRKSIAAKAGVGAADQTGAAAQAKGAVPAAAGPKPPAGAAAPKAAAPAAAAKPAAPAAKK